MKAKNFFRITMLVVIAAFVLTQCKKEDPEPEKKPAKLETVSNLSFEDTEVGKSTSKKVTLTNSGELVLKVSNISLEGTNKAAFDTDGVAKEVQPGKSYQFKVTFSPKSEGDNTANLKIVSNGGNATVALSGKATPKPVATFVITPETKDFGEIEVNKTAEQEFTITNGGNAELELKSFVLTGTNKDEFSTNGTATKVAAGKTQTFKVTFAPKTVGDKTATLTITSNLGEHKVTLSGKAKAAIIAVTGVTVKDKTSLIVGDSETLTATVSPATATNKKVTWSSSDTTVATVDSTGKVTALKAGTTTITVTTESEGKTAECMVTVKNKVIAVTGVSVKDKTSMVVGESETLTATVSPATATNKKVTWSSSDTTVATVDNTGEVTALKAGTTTITVTTESEGKTAECMVTVKNKVIAVTGVTVKDKTSMVVGNTEQLTATVTPTDATNKNITWSSSDTTVATVDNTGKITALKAGTAEITVTTEDGSKTAKCEVTVTVTVTSVSLNKTTVTLNEGATETLTATIQPNDATNKNVTWSSSNTAVATVDNTGEVTAVAEGTATITITTEDGSHKATCEVMVIAPTPTLATVTVEGGTFTMGSPAGVEYDDERPQHQVTLSTFKISKYEITNAQYAEFMNAIGADANGSVGGTEYLDMEDDSSCQITHNGSSFQAKTCKEDYPVIEVTWYGAKAYAEWAGGRLPTEAEWEYAARGGNQSKGYKYSGSDNINDVAWYWSNSTNTNNSLYKGKGTLKVGTKTANELGIHDMSGNVWEWCSDWYGTYPSAAQTNPTGAASGSGRVLRGGSWYNDAGGCRVALRNYDDPNSSYNAVGFRVVFP